MVAAALGIAVPAHRVVLPGEPVPPLDGLAGERVVVKVLAAEVAHKTDRGGVRVVPRETAAVESAIAAMSPAFADEEVLGWLVAEFVAHDTGPGGEVLLGVRRTAEFGPVLVLGVGGTHAEMLAPALAPAVLAGGRARDGEGPRPLPFPGGGAAHRRCPGECPGRRRRGTGLVGGPARWPRCRGCPPRWWSSRPTRWCSPPAGRWPSTPSPGWGACPRRAPDRPATQIDRLLHPRSMAIVGVSERMNPGRVILENALAAGFPAGSVTVVKPGADEIAGCRCVPDLASLPGRVDLLVLSIAAAAAPAALEEVVARGAAEGVILIPGGLGEREGSEALAERARAAVAEGRRRGSGPVVNGGNSMGIRSVPGRYDATFIPGYKASPPADAPAAPLAVISQSGAFAIARLDRLALLRPRYLVTLGNQLDLTAGDYLAFWQDDPAVEVFACYLEGFRPGDGGRFLDAAARIRERGGTVILYLGGRTPAGAAAVSSHTASLAPDHRVARALAADAGVLVAESLEEFEDLLRLAVLLRGREIAGPGLGAVSNAGFECVALADTPGPFSFPSLGAATVARVEAVLTGLRLQGLVGVQNPLDLTPMADAAGFGDAAAAVLADPAVQVGVVGCVPLTPVLATLEPGPGHSEDLAAAGSLARRLADLWRATTKAWVLVIDGGSLYDPLARYLERAGVPVFRAADRALRALGRYAAVRLGR